jgi:hypothetical protein
MSDSSAPIRSYQRIFRPERRIYQIDGKRLPVPGGVPLVWLGWAFAALSAVLVLGQRSPIFLIVATAVGAIVGASDGGVRGALMCGAGVAGSVLVAGVVLGWLDWPLRLLVLPAMLATVASRPSSDGRPAHRYLISWISLYTRPACRSLDRTLVLDGGSRMWAPQVWVAPDQHGPVLQRGRVHGPARLVFAREVVVIPGRGRAVLRPAEGHRCRAGERVAEVVELGAGQVVEVRP